MQNSPTRSQITHYGQSPAFSIDTSTVEDEKIMARFISAKLLALRSDLNEALAQREEARQRLDIVNDNIAIISKTISTMLHYQKKLNLPDEDLSAQFQTQGQN